MNHGLSHLANVCGLGDPQNEPLRLAFGLACALRVRHLLEDAGALRCLSVLEAFVNGGLDRPTLEAARQEIAEIANGHRGSASIDGSAHAAVSATYAVANALAGRALEAAGYAAYAAVYAYGGYAVTDPSAFEGEFAWQIEKLRELAGFPVDP
ncbi:hypothetical protein [Polaromonas sp.]|uniref:hypothetical protein n=1 Tax=Polaromonas sp. TaxID=1869339 RepID=UPI00326380D3